MQGIVFKVARLPNRNRVAGLALALILMLAWALPAEAKVPRRFFGVEAQPSFPGDRPAMSGADFKRMRSARVGSLRVNFHWGSVGQHPARYDWRYHDSMVKGAAKARVQLLAVLVGTASLEVGGRPAFETRSGRASFQRFIRHVLDRYGVKGSFWRRHRRLPYMPVRHFQVWNEPNYGPAWYDEPNARQYAAVLKLAAREIRRHDRRAVIATAGILAASSEGPLGSEYLEDLYASTPGIARYFDIVAIHPYAVDQRGVEGELIRIRRVMRLNADERARIWITELGWGTGGGNQYLSTTPAGQASRMRGAFELLLRKRRRYHVDKAIWYSWRDRPQFDTDGWNLHCGLFTLTRQAKPAWSMFQSFSRRAGR